MNVTSLYTQFGATVYSAKYHRPHPPVEVTSTPPQAGLSGSNISNNTAEVLSKDDDYVGSMLFCVAVICVYGLSIVAFIAGHLKRRQISKEEETQISYYLKRMRSDQQTKMDVRSRVIRFKSQILTDFSMGQRHNRRESTVAKGCRDVHADFNVGSRRTPEGAEHRCDDGDDDEVFLTQAEGPGGSSPSSARANVQASFGCSASCTSVTLFVSKETGIAASVPSLSLSQLWQNDARGRSKVMTGCSDHDENEYGDDNEEDKKSKPVCSPKLPSCRSVSGLSDIDERDDDDDNFLQSNNSRKGLLANQHSDFLCSLSLDGKQNMATYLSDHGKNTSKPDSQ